MFTGGLKGEQATDEFGKTLVVLVTRSLMITTMGLSRGRGRPVDRGGKEGLLLPLLLGLRMTLPHPLPVRRGSLHLLQQTSPARARQVVL